MQTHERRFGRRMRIPATAAIKDQLRRAIVADTEGSRGGSEEVALDVGGNQVFVRDPLSVAKS